MSLRTPAEGPGPARRGRDSTGRTEPACAATSARGAATSARGSAPLVRGLASLVGGVDHLAGRHSGGATPPARGADPLACGADCLAGRQPGGSAPLARGADHPTSRRPGGQVPTLAGTPVDASAGRQPPYRRRPSLSIPVPVPGAPEASVQWSTVADECGSARIARPWTDLPRSPRTDLLTTTQASRTGNEPPPWCGAEDDRQGIRAAHHPPTGETP